MSNYKSILKSNIVKVEDKTNKRNVKITCANGNAGKLVQSTITQNSSALFGGYKMNNIATGGGNKDFTVKFEIRDGAKYFYNKIVDIMNDSSISTTEAEKSGIQNLAQSIKSTVSGVISTVTDPAAGVDGTATTATPAITSLQNNEDTPSSSSSKMPLIIGGAVVLLLVIGLVIWKAKK